MYWEILDGKFILFLPKIKRQNNINILSYNLYFIIIMIVDIVYNYFIKLN